MDKVNRIGVLIITIVVIISLYVIQSTVIDPVSEVVKIGFIGPLTGDADSYGKPISNSVRIAVDVVNQSGGINGKPLEVVYEDGKCNGEDALRAVEKLVYTDKVQVIIGAVCSGETLAILPVTEKEKVIVMSPASSSPDLSGAGKYFFRTTPSDLKGGEKLARLITKTYKHKRVAIISEKTDYAQGLARVFKQNLEQLGESW